ncbi:hypothetical protein G6F68_010336 [Rhizopus microsporus]|nr:hypothetical protein G6F68_010336 [Rhizopus microsporus]
MGSGDLHGVHAVGDAELAGEHRNVLHAQRHLRIQLDRQHITNLQPGQVAQGHALAGQHAGQRHLGDVELLAQGLAPALVAVVAVALDARVEQFADRLQHRVGQGDVDVAAATVQFHVQAAHHHVFARGHDVGEVRVDLRVDVLEVDVHHRCPGLAQVGEGLLQQQVDHPHFGGGELAALDARRVAPVAAEEVVDDGEHQGRLEHDQAGTAQRLEADQVQVGRHIQRVHVIVELDQFDAAHRQLGRAADQVEQADPPQAREALVDHFQGRHATADDAVLAGEVVRTCLA